MSLVAPRRRILPGLGIEPVHLRMSGRFYPTAPGSLLPSSGAQLPGPFCVDSAFNRCLLTDELSGKAGLWPWGLRSAGRQLLFSSPSPWTPGPVTLVAPMALSGCVVWSFPSVPSASEPKGQVAFLSCSWGSGQLCSGPPSSPAHPFHPDGSAVQ